MDFRRCPSPPGSLYGSTTTKEMVLMTTTLNRFAPVAATLALALTGASAAHAFPIGPAGGSGGKDCKTPEGTVIKDGDTGTSGGKTYKCTNGVGCQVENGSTTDKCSHMATLRISAGRATLKMSAAH
jgi:hypothetical protein